jgi:hypothetical protein
VIGNAAYLFPLFFVSAPLFLPKQLVLADFSLHSFADGI